MCPSSHDLLRVLKAREEGTDVEGLSAIVEHVRDCADCGENLDAMRKVRAAGRRAIDEIMRREFGGTDVAREC